jgi:hypothetical protein
MTPGTSKPRGFWADMAAVLIALILAAVVAAILGRGGR